MRLLVIADREDSDALLEAAKKQKPIKKNEEDYIDFRIVHDLEEARTVLFSRGAEHIVIRKQHAKFTRAAVNKLVKAAKTKSQIHTL